MPPGRAGSLEALLLKEEEQVPPAARRAKEAVLKAQGLDKSRLVAVWQAVGNFVDEELVKGKGVNIPQLLRISFTRAAHDRKAICTISEAFARQYKLSVKRPPEALQVACCELNFFVVAAQAGVSKDVARAALPEISRRFGVTAGHNATPVRLNLGTTGALVADDMQALRFAFARDGPAGTGLEGAAQSGNASFMKNAPAEALTLNLSGAGYAGDGGAD